MKIVQFKDGKYGVRRGFWPFYRFKDLTDAPFWWGLNDKYFRDCKTDDLGEARRVARDISAPDYGKVID